MKSKFAQKVKSFEKSIDKTMGKKFCSNVMKDTITPENLLKFGSNLVVGFTCGARDYVDEASQEIERLVYLNKVDAIFQMFDDMARPYIIEIDLYEARMASYKKMAIHGSFLDMTTDEVIETMDGFYETIGCGLDMDKYHILFELSIPYFQKTWESC